MNTISDEHKFDDFLKHLKDNWVESIIFCIFFGAFLYLLFSSSVNSYG